jgi:hypothetical protein
MAIVLDRAQRDAVYGFVVSDLAETGGLAAALEASEIKRAQWLRRNFEQAARLLDQIGWEKVGSQQRYEVELGDAEVVALFGRLHERASRLIDDAVSEFARAKPYIRRIMNQAIFEAIWIWDEDNIRTQLATPFKEIHAIANTHQPDGQDNPQEEPATPQEPAPRERIPVGAGAISAEHDEAPDTWEESGDFALGLIRTSMVGTAGFEPATSRV